MTFSVTKFKKKLKKRTQLRIQTTSCVYLAAVFDYLVKELVDLPEIIVQKFRWKNIKPMHIDLAIRFDVELNAFLHNVIIPEASRLSL